jgi:hypothetical protein
MKLVIAAVALASLVLCLAVRSGTSDEPSSNSARSSSGGVVNDRDGSIDSTRLGSLVGDTKQSAADSFAEANWSLKATPGAVRKHQRIDPVTGKPVPLTDGQREVSDDDDQTALDQLEADGAKKAKSKQIGFGDPNAELETVR